MNENINVVTCETGKAKQKLVSKVPVPSRLAGQKILYKDSKSLTVSKVLSKPFHTSSSPGTILQNATNTKQILNKKVRQPFLFNNPKVSQTSPTRCTLVNQDQNQNWLQVGNTLEQNEINQELLPARASTPDPTNLTPVVKVEEQDSQETCNDFHETNKDGEYKSSNSKVTSEEKSSRVPLSNLKDSSKLGGSTSSVQSSASGRSVVFSKYVFFQDGDTKKMIPLLIGKRSSDAFPTKQVLEGDSLQNSNGDLIHVGTNSSTSLNAKLENEPGNFNVTINVNVDGKNDNDDKDEFQDQSIVKTINSNVINEESSSSSFSANEDDSDNIFENQNVDTVSFRQLSTKVSHAELKMTKPESDNYQNLFNHLQSKISGVDNTLNNQLINNDLSPNKASNDIAMLESQQHYAKFQKSKKISEDIENEKPKKLVNNYTCQDDSILSEVNQKDLQNGNAFTISQYKLHDFDLPSDNPTETLNLYRPNIYKTLPHNVQQQNNLKSSAYFSDDYDQFYDKIIKTRVLGTQYNIGSAENSSNIFSKIPQHKKLSFTPLQNQVSDTPDFSIQAISMLSRSVERPRCPSCNSIRSIPSVTSHPNAGYSTPQPNTAYSNNLMHDKKMLTDFKPHKLRIQTATLLHDDDSSTSHPQNNFPPQLRPYVKIHKLGSHSFSERQSLNKDHTYINFNHDDSLTPLVPTVLKQPLMTYYDERVKNEFFSHQNINNHRESRVNVFQQPAPKFQLRTQFIPEYASSRQVHVPANNREWNSAKIQERMQVHRNSLPQKMYRTGLSYDIC